MKATQVAVLSCGCLAAFQAALAADAGERPLPDMPALASSLAYADDLMTASYLAGNRRAGGLQVHFDSGTLDDVHRLVGFWPSMQWLNSRTFDTSMASLGYSWRNLRLEGALVRGRESGERRNNQLLRFDSVSRRFSYQFGSHWSLKLSRGFQRGPDQLGQERRARRRTASLTYSGHFQDKPWHATVAAGRGRGLSGHSSAAFLFDSAMHIRPRHTLFGRMERSGHDELFVNEDGPRERSIEASKVSVGYLYDVRTNGPARMEFGALVSRRNLPLELMPYYGDKPLTYAVFMRLQMPIR